MGGGGAEVSVCVCVCVCVRVCACVRARAHAFVCMSLCLSGLNSFVVVFINKSIPTYNNTIFCRERQTSKLI